VNEPGSKLQARFVQIRAANSDETISDQDFAGQGLFPWLSMVSNRRSLAA
jgi:hypothetical protein